MLRWSRVLKCWLLALAFNVTIVTCAIEKVQVQSNGLASHASNTASRGAPYLSPPKGRRSSPSSTIKIVNRQRQPTARSDVPFSPPLDEDGYLLHGLADLRGLPHAFNRSKCAKFPDSRSWLEFAIHTEDILKMGDKSKYWTFVYALECAATTAPPNAEAVLYRAKLLIRVGDFDAAIATLRYGRRIAPKSPMIKWDLANELGRYQDRVGPRAKREHDEMIRLFQDLLSQNCNDANTCYELAQIRAHTGKTDSALECLEKAVHMDLNHAGYASKYWSQSVATSMDQIRKVRAEFSMQSRNFREWNETAKHVRITPVHEWLAGYDGANAASSYTTRGLLGQNYRPLPVPPTLSALSLSGTAALRAIVSSVGSRFSEAREALQNLLETEQPEVCQRIDALCTDGPTRLLYSLASPKTAHVNTHIGIDQTGKSKLDFATITSSSLNISGTPFGTPWRDEPYPMFPLYMVNTMRSICDCAELDCDLAGRVWLMDVDAIRDTIESMKAHADVREMVNKPDALGFTPAALAIINNDALTFAALLNTGTVDFSATDVWGHSVVQLLYLVTPTPEAEAMRAAASRFLQEHGGPELPPLLRSVARQLPKVEGLDVATGWDPTTRTLPWAPVSVWTKSLLVDDVDASQVTMADIVDKYISAGRPVVIKGALRNCVKELRQWSKESLRQSVLANVTYKAYSGESGIMTTFREFIDTYMSTGTLSDESKPRYILAQKGSKVMERELKRITEVSFLTDLLKCIPYDLQEYFHLPPPELPGVWSQYTLSMGGAGAGASFHMHEAAINFVVYGTRKW